MATPDSQPNIGSTNTGPVEANTIGKTTGIYNPMEVPVKAAERIKETLGNTVDYITEARTGKLIVAVILLFIIIYVIIYIYRLYSSTTLKTTTFLKKPVSAPFELTNVSKSIPIPDSINGSRYSISFWVYVDDIKHSSKPKFLIGRGVNEHNMYPFFSITTDNKLKVKFEDSTPSEIITDIFSTNRWVNVALVVDETLAQLYIDGKFSRAVNSSGQFKKSVGDVFMGKTSRMDRIDGYFSKIQVFNYAITIDHTKIIYKAGPLHKSILSMIGIPMYGLRNPFMRLDDASIE